MIPHYGIDSSIFVRLVTAEPEGEFKKTIALLEKRLLAEPAVEFFVSNQVIGESYIALQHHYQISKSDAREAMLETLTSGLCTPLNGPSILAILKAQTGCGLIDRLIADDYTRHSLRSVTNDKKMAKLPWVERL